MNDTAVITNDLDRLAERVERAATLVTTLRNRCSDLEKLGAATQQQLDDLNAKLQGHDAAALVTELTTLRQQAASTHSTLQGRDAATLVLELGTLQKQLDETKSKLQGQDPGAIVTELAALKKDQREWLNERRDVTARIEAISAKLERIE